MTDAGIGHDILGSYENGICQPIFSVIAKNAEESQKDAFIQVIESTLTRLVKKGSIRMSLAAGIITMSSVTGKLILEAIRRD